jgi:hypothetical protein
MEYSIWADAAQTGSGAVKTLPISFLLRAEIT